MIQVVTRLGTGALSAALSSSAELLFTRCAIGSGEFDPASRDARAVVSLVATEAIVPVSAVRKEDDGVAVVTDLHNSMIPGGTAIREYGLFARLNGGDEFLFSYGYTLDPEIVPPADEATYERRYITHIAMSDEEAEITVKYDTYASMLEELLPGYLAVKLDKDAAGAAGGVAQLGEDGKVPYSQLPDDLGRGYATASEVRARLYRRKVIGPEAYYGSITDEQIAKSAEVRAAWNGAEVATGAFDNVPSDVIATETEVIDRFVNG